MIGKKWLRLTLGTILGGISGFGLTTSILPAALSITTGIESFFVRFAFSGYAAHVTLAWAVCGWVIVKMGSPKMGAIFMGVVGVASDVALLTLAGVGAETKILLAGGFAAGIYGVIGGLLIGTILRRSESPSTTMDKECAQARVSAPKLGDNPP